MFASAGTTLKLHSWTQNQLEPVAVYKPKKNSFQQRITHVSWCHDNSYILILQEGTLPQILSTKDRSNISLIHTIQALKEVSAVRFKNYTKRLIALENSNGDLVLYDTKTRNIAKKLENLNSAVHNLDFNSKDNQLAAVTDQGVVIFSDLNSTNNFVKHCEVCGEFSTVKFHPSTQNIIAVGDHDGQVSLWDNEKNKLVNNLQRHSLSVTSLAITDNQKTVISSGYDHKICIFDYSTQDYLFRMNLQQAVTALDLSADELYLSAGLEDGCIYIYDIRHPLKPLTCSHSHDGAINKIAFEKVSMSVEESFERNSGTTLNESEFEDNSRLDMGDIEKLECSDEKIKKDILKMIKTHMNYLDNQLTEHCMKFQSFINNEFDSIHNAMARWDVFNVCDGSEMINFSETNEQKSTRSSYGSNLKD